MKFSAQFEFHKIPEWYSEYLDYKRFKAMIRAFKLQVKDGHLHKLRGLYNLTSKRCVIPMDIFGKNDAANKKTEQQANTITIRTTGQHQRDTHQQEIRMDEESQQVAASPLMLENDEQMTEQDIEEYQYIKKKITDIVEGKELQPMLYENVHKSRRDSLMAMKNDPDFFGSPSLHRNQSEHKKGNQARMLLQDNQDLTHLYEKIEMPHLQKEDIRYLQIDLDDPQQRVRAEQLLNDFVQSFLLEVERIENTYQKFYKQYQEEFTNLKDRYIRKQNYDEMDQIDRDNMMIQHTQSVMTMSQAASLEHSMDNGEEVKQPLIAQKGISNMNKDVGKNEQKPLTVPRQPSIDPRRASIVSPKQRVEAQKITKVKDELEYATNWRRAFNKIFTHLKWLSAYAKINEIALLKLIEKFMKHFFVVKDNLINKKLQKIIEMQTFAKRTEVNSQLKEVIAFFAENFTQGKKERAIELLEQHNTPIRMKDASLMSYFGGLLTMIMVTLIVVSFAPFERDPALSKTEIFSTMSTFRFLLMVLFTVASAGVAIKVLRQYKVNYIFIFDLDPHYKVTYLQLVRITLVMLTVWSFCLVGHIAVVKLKYIFERPAAGFALAVFVIFLSLCCAPFHCFYKRARKELLVVLWHIVISPFGLVKFKHFFMADILTSFVVPLKDVGNMVCFFASSVWLDSMSPDTKAFPGLVYYLMIVPLLPFWFRFAQCLVRYRETKLTANLINAGKYTSAFLVQVVGAIKTWNGTASNPLKVVIGSVTFASTLYCLYWDYKMDWGLFRETPGKGKKYLRDKLLYPTWFYYYAMISNMFLRFFWVLGLITFDNSYIDKQIIPLIQCLFEGFRRAQWALIRIENENVNNFERYRTILQIPAFKEDYEEDQQPSK